MTSGPPAKAGAPGIETASASDAAAMSLRVRMTAPRRRAFVDGAAQECPQCGRVDGPALRIEHALLVRAQRVADDARAREQAGVVVAVHRDAVAHAEFPVAEP